MIPINDFSEDLIKWQISKGRNHLPWQIDKNPYKVWISEIMLQQTQVSTVIQYYQRFIKKFSSIKLLAGADQNEILKYWSGLGYYARARNLHKCAQIIEITRKGVFPDTLAALCELPGIGKSTAGAILSLGFNIRAPILDGNVKRILARYYALAGNSSEPAFLKQLWDLSEQHTPKQNFSTYNQALMDLGAMICTRRHPKCQECPIQKNCAAHKQNRVHEFPTAKITKPKPQREVRMLILRNKLADHVLLKKCPPSGIWGGLWSFPECLPQQTVEHWCAEELNCEVIQQLALNSFKHSFTHFDLLIYPLLLTIAPKKVHKAMEPDHYIWYKINDPLPGGLPAPVIKLLKILEEKIYDTNDLL